MFNSPSAFRPLDFFQLLSYKGDTMINDDLHVVHTRATRLDIHKMTITASIRIYESGRDAHNVRIARTSVRC